ncbi:MAG TPA: ABC transporter permease [Polyangiaceae bacterium]
MDLPRLVLRSAGRHPARAALTVLAAAVATLAFVLLRAAAGAWTTGAQSAVRDRIVTRHRTSFAVPLPLRHVSVVAGLPHVRAATHWTWFGGRLAGENRGGPPFAVSAVDARTYFDVFDEAVLPPDQRQAWLDDRAGAVVGDLLAARFGWKPGDRVTLESSVFPNDAASPWTFTIRGVYTTAAQSMDRSTMLIRWDYVDDRVPHWGKGHIGWIISRADSPAHAAEVASAIDAALDGSQAPTSSQDEGSFRSSVLGGAAALLGALDALSAGTLALLTLVLANTIAMGARERTREYAVLRAIGFRPWHVGGLVVAEGVLLGAAGAAGGVLGARALLDAGFARWLEERTLTFFPYVRLGLPLALAAVAAGALAGGAAAAIPGWRASRLSTVDALRRA